MANNSVRSDSPDPSKYHANVGGMPGTMIPRAGRDGQSLAFDANKPQTVIVDPGEEGGGFQLDISQLAKAKSKFNSAAMRAGVAEDPTAFYREISQKALATDQLQEKLKTKLEAKMKEPAMPEPIQPLDALPSIGNDNPAPQALPAEAAMEKMAESFDTEGAIEKLLAEEKLKAEQLSEQRRAMSAIVNDAGGVAQPSSEMRELRTHMGKQGQAINALIGAVTRMTEKANEQPVVQAEEPIHATKAPELPTEKIEPEEPKPDWGFGSLNIPCLTGGKPQRPQYETYFEMSKMGTMAARYHAVVAGQDCLALVYDTRFEDGFQYLPPNLGEEKVTVSIPKLDNAVYTCSSLGLHWTIGCLDVIILIKHGDEE